MNFEDFHYSSKIVTDFIVDYFKKLPEKKLKNDVEKGFLEYEMEPECPKSGEDFIQIFQDFSAKILPGVTPWLSPHNHSQWPVSTSFASIIAEFLITGLNSVSVNWESTPAVTELELHIMNWLAKLFALPQEFYYMPEHFGGGFFQNTIAETFLHSLNSARKRSIQKHKAENESCTLRPLQVGFKQVCYASTLVHPSLDRIIQVTLMKLHSIIPDEDGKISGKSLRNAFEKDLQQGLSPCIFISTMGTMDLCSYDNLQDVGAVCREFNVWLHVDAEYAGNTLICPEMRYMSKGIEYADSIAINMHKLLRMSIDVVAFWLKDYRNMKEILGMNPLYLKHKTVGISRDLLNAQLGTGRKFKSLQVWIVLKCLGSKGLQENVRMHLSLANKMVELIQDDKRFEIVRHHLGIVCFRLKIGNEATKELVERVNSNGNISIGAGEWAEKYFIKFVVSQNMKESDVVFAWKEIATLVE